MPFGCPPPNPALPDPALAANQRGDVVALVSSPEALIVRSLSGSGDWSAPDFVPESGKAQTAQLGLDDAGTIVLLWRDGLTGQARIARRPAGGPWQRIDVSGFDVPEVLAVAPNATVRVLSRDTRPNRPGTLFARRFDPAAGWTPTCSPVRPG